MEYHKSGKLEKQFLNVHVNTRIFLCLMIMDCGEKRSFSLTTKIKHELRITTLPEQFSNWSLICILNEIFKKIHSQDITEDQQSPKNNYLITHLSFIY